MTLLVLGFVAYLSNSIFSPTQDMGIMGADYSAITSAYDLSLSKVHHWCIQGDNDSCKCEDPLEANSRSEFKSWNAAHRSNVADVNLYRAVYGAEPTMIEEETGKPRPPLDVAFLGESVVEAMDGRWLGKQVVKALNGPDGNEGPEARRKPDIGRVFEKLYRKDKGGPVEGVALGIAGDNTANVLWRLQHDEMPYDFNPKVWWLVLGMNDLTRMQCSEEIVVLGILRVVEEIRLRKPDAKIVINSLLPMINFQGFHPPKMVDFADFKESPNNKAKENMEIDSAMKKFLSEDQNRNLRSRGKKKRKKSSSRKKPRKKRHRKNNDDDVTEGPELEKAMERRKKELEKHDKRIRDKVFKDNEQYRPKKPLSPLLPMIKKRVLPPVWPAVHTINDKLKEFCTKHESITFFDATSIFATDEGGGKHHLHHELISPRGHPTAIGFAVWEGQIMARLHNMLKGMETTPLNQSKDADDLIVDEFSDDDEVDDDNMVEEEDPEVEELSPVSETSADVNDDGGEETSVGTTANSGEESTHASADDEGKSGDEGSEHVSEGKENDPPTVQEQPSRSEPSNSGDEDETDDEDEGSDSADEDKDDNEDSENSEDSNDEEDEDSEDEDSEDEE